MPITKLIPDPKGEPADSHFQQTTLADDVMGRYMCNSWDEVARQFVDGKAPFDVVIIGAGMCGAYCAEKLYRRDSEERLRILLIEEGAFLFPTHQQNLPGFPGTRSFSKLVWRTPWIGNKEFIGNNFPGQAFCVGGRSVFWSGWAPRLTPEDLAKWPKAAADYLINGGYALTEREIGADVNTDYIVQRELYRTLFKRMDGAEVPNITRVREAPLAVVGSSPMAGVFPFDKYSSVTLLLDAVHADISNQIDSDAGNSIDDDKLSSRRLMVLPRAHVQHLVRNGDKVVELKLGMSGRAEPLSLPLKSGCMVVLANGTIEATRLALTDLGIGDKTLGQPRVGNFMAHLRSNIFVRIRRTAFKELPEFNPDMSEVAAFIVRGESDDRRFHLQVVAAATAEAPETLIWQMIPDNDALGQFIADQQDPDWISIVFRGIGEMEGNRDRGPGAANKWESWIRLEDGGELPRADVMLKASARDEAFWRIMDGAALNLAKAIAGDPANIQYLDGSWVDHELDLNRKNPPWHDGVGTTYHEAGTLFMGEEGKSITDTDGKFHHLDNVYVASPALFPTVGSANPSMTALSLARHSADAILKRHGVTPNESVLPQWLYFGKRADGVWVDRNFSGEPAAGNRVVATTDVHVRLGPSGEEPVSDTINEGDDFTVKLVKEVVPGIFWIAIA